MFFSGVFSYSNKLIENRSVRERCIKLCSMMLCECVTHIIYIYIYDRQMFTTTSIMITTTILYKKILKNTNDVNFFNSNETLQIS